MLSERFEKRLDEVVAQYPDYHRGVYRHVFGSIERINRRIPDTGGHSVSAVFLAVNGVVPSAVEDFGILAFSVFCFWGVRTGSDLRSVFERLVQFKVLKQDGDEHLEQLDALNLEEVFLEALKKR